MKQEQRKLVGTLPGKGWYLLKDDEGRKNPEDFYVEPVLYFAMVQEGEMVDCLPVPTGKPYENILSDGFNYLAIIPERTLESFRGKVRVYHCNESVEPYEEDELFKALRGDKEPAPNKEIKTIRVEGKKPIKDTRVEQWRG